MTVPYLSGGESATAARMNSLFTAFDDKLKQMLRGFQLTHGKSFALARNANIPVRMVGKVFYFLAGGVSVYAGRFPGPRSGGNPVNNLAYAAPTPVAYDHSLFTAAIAAIDLTKVQYDEVNHIATIPRVDDSFYVVSGSYILPGGTGDFGLGFFEHSLARHYLLHQGSVDSAPVPYYIRDGRNIYPALKHSVERGIISNVATITTSEKHYYLSGQVTTMSGFAVSAYNVPSVAITVIDATHFSYAVTHANEATTADSGGIISPDDAIEEGQGPPEKQLKYAVAEIVLEGQDSVIFPDSYDKYCCFRVHNLNPGPATVAFGGHYSLSLAPYECKTLRRDSVTTNYRLGGAYFWKFEHGDPRFFRFVPTTAVLNPFSPPAFSAVQGQPEHGRASNGMTANNLTNPSVLYDWLNSLAIDKEHMVQEDGYEYWTKGMIPDNWGRYVETSQVSQFYVYAALLRDLTIVADAYPKNASLFGDPSNGSTILGDLLHHKGRIVIVRTSKTLVDHTNGDLPLVTFDEVEFRGYGTIVADFAAKLLQVAPGLDGNLNITNVDPDNYVDLLPISTNLLKTGESVPARIGLNDNPGGGDSPFVIEYAVLEAPGSTSADFSLTNIAGQRVFHHLTASVPDTRTYNDVNPSTGAFVASVTVSGPDRAWVYNDVLPTGCAAIYAIHTVTVTDLLALITYWGDFSSGFAGDAYIQYDNRKLTLTPEGLVLTFKERLVTDTRPSDATGFPSADQTDLMAWRTNHYRDRKRVFRFRGHGWGYHSMISGSDPTGFYPARKGQVKSDPDFVGEVVNSAGRDFQLDPMDLAASASARLQRSPVENLLIDPDVDGDACQKRFWKARGDATMAILDNYLTPAAYEGQQFIGGGNAIYLNDKIGSKCWMPLEIEHYNAMAAAVNSIVQCYPLTGAAYSLVNSLGQVATFAAGKVDTFGPGHAEAVPVPFACYMSFGYGSPEWQLMTDLGLTLKTPGDLPDSLSSKKDIAPTSGVLRWMEEDTLRQLTDPQYSSAVARSQGLADGTGCLGTWIPGTWPGGTPTEGDFYVISEYGWFQNALGHQQFCYKGDLLIYEGGVWGCNTLGTMAPLFTLPMGAGWAQVAHTGQWLILTPYMPSVTNSAALSGIGTWAAGPSLPANPSPGDYTNAGQYLTITGHYDPYHDGSYLVWDGTQWVLATSDYANFFWNHTDDVKAFFEGTLEADFIYNELVVPLSLVKVNAEPTTSVVSAGNGSGPTPWFDVVGNVGFGGFSGEGLGVGVAYRFLIREGGSNWKMRTVYDGTYDLEMANLKTWPASGPPLVAGHFLTDTPNVHCSIMSFSGQDDWLAGPPGETVFWQLLWYMMLSTSSAGTVPTGKARVLPTTRWGPDGSFAGSADNARRLLLGSTPLKPFSYAPAALDLGPWAAEGVSLFLFPGDRLPGGTGFGWSAKLLIDPFFHAIAVT